MLTFLFWNLKQSRPDVVANVARKRAVDVIMLAECPTSRGQMLGTLNKDTNDYFFIPSECPKINIYARFHEQYLPPLREEDDFSIRRLALPQRLDLLLCVAHFPSKQSLREPVDRQDYATIFSGKLADVEDAAKINRTIVTGDLNMNPYEDGLVMARALHAVPTRALAKREQRTSLRTESRIFFYNPMWRHFGERMEGHAGTYFYSSPKSRADYWNIYDQVLLRPDLLPYFQDDDLEIIHEDVGSNVSFLKNDGVPNRDEISDHLPILFRIQI
jgi:hypothetical protein